MAATPKPVRKKVHSSGAMKGIISSGKYKGYSPEDVKEVREGRKVMEKFPLTKEEKNKHKKFLDSITAKKRKTKTS